MQCFRSFLPDSAILPLQFILPKGRASYCNIIANCNNMQLNPSKCKLMRVDFLHYNSCYSQPIAVGESVIESVQSFKLLGVYISVDLSWSTHCDYIIKKSNRRLYALRKLKSCGVQEGELVAVYCSLLRSVLE